MRMLTTIDTRGFIVTCQAEGGEAADGGRSGTDATTTVSTRLSARSGIIVAVPQVPHTIPLV